MILSLLSIIYGATMKIADLLNEHGLRLFKYANLLFGLLWGLSGLILSLQAGSIIASVVLAMNVAFIVRGRLDYLNHQIASSIIILGIIMFIKVAIIELIVFYLIFLIFGFIKDYLGDTLQKKNKLSEMMLYYPISTFIYSVIFGYWELFIVFTVYMISYNFVKLVARKKGYV